MNSLLTDRPISPEARRYLHGLSKSLPAGEYAAVDCWLSAFYDYQLEWILDWRRRSILNKARQIGASHAYAGAAVLWSLFGETTSIISIGLTEANEVLDKCAIHADILRRLGCKLLQQTRKNATQIRFVTGGRILSLPSSGGRGFTGNVLLDEFAYHENPERVWDNTSAMITRNGKLRILSTPDGVGNLFYELFTHPDKRKDYGLHQVTFEQALTQGLTGPGLTMEDAWKNARNDPRVFDQVYNCKFLGTELQYIPTEAVRDCTTDQIYLLEGDYYAGLDIGKNVDRTVLIVVRKAPDGMRAVAHIASCKHTDNKVLSEMVSWAFRKFKLKRLVVDATGIGAFPADQMEKKYGRIRVEKLSFTSKSKEELATCMYAAFTEGTIKIPQTDRNIFPPGSAAQLREDICSIRREITKSNNIRYDAPRSEKGHADSAWALAMAIHASGSLNRSRHEVKLTGGHENNY